MKNLYLSAVLVFCTLCSFGQVGVGTTTPNSTLDVRGSLSIGYRAFSGASSAAITDNMLVFTGVSAATLTLPDAVACTGRVYWIKNTSSNASALTIATTSAQTIDGLASWTITQTNKAIRLVSNGANWWVAAESLPGTGTAWSYGGNAVTAAQNIGTTSNFDFPFITNNTEKMRLTSTGNLGVGTLTFNATNPEKLVVDAGVTTSVNAIVGKGSINSYLQLNIQNLSNGTGASSDVVATADNGNETTNYVDMGINSSTNASGVMGAANDAYFYNIGQNLLIGTGTAAKSLVFMTGGTTQSSNERMRITGTGSIGIGTNAPAATLDVNGTYKLGTAGTVLTNMIKTNVTLTDATTFIYTSTEQVTIAVTGATVNATVILNPRTALPTGIGIGWVRVSSANNITIGFTNTDATARAVGTVVFDVTIIQ